MRIENSFIPVRGVGEATERRLWAAGVTHWDQVDVDEVAAVDTVGPTLADRIDSFVDVATRRLADGDVSFVADSMPSESRWRLYENVREAACFLDIETTGLDATCNDVTTVSVHRGGETRTYVRGRDLTAERLRRELEASSLLVTFNGKRFDVPFLEACYGVDVAIPHVDLLYPCRRVGLDGGLKEIERDLGIERELPELSGRDAVRLWRQYERGDEGALERLVRYNRADTANLERVMDSVARQLHEAVFESARSGDVAGGE